MTNEELMYASPEDIAFYHKCVEGLPTLAGLNGTGKDADGIDIPYGCGPHSVRCLREIVEIVKPKHIWEIGLNLGFSSALWLNLTEDCMVVSCDISKKQETLVAADFLETVYFPRFDYFNRNDEDIKDIVMGLGKTFDLVFIDGGHLIDDVRTDIKDAIDLKIPYLAFDDILPQFGPGVMPAIKEYPQLQLVKEMGNIALYKNTIV